ncbi:hypothetical protein [Methylomicrobium agile]|uniref:hypothetical protein n=1 Tax=Methylomicrobium agile TaxID=39774 RepID=UPI0004DF5EFA|nr:hypothetical protein [Methylomicrobium agile]
MNHQTKTQFIAVASITSELTAVISISKEISLAAANAKAIAFRAGDKARGFQPITDFINDLAKEMIQNIEIINELATSLCRITIKEYRKTEAFNKFELITTTCGSAVHAHSMQKPLADAKAIVQNCQLQFKRDVALLMDHLDTVTQHAKTAGIIATYSRIEASQAGEYLQSLQTVSKSVDNAARKIHDHVQRCIIALSRFGSANK